MKNNLLAAVAVGAALLMTGCGLAPTTPEEQQYAIQQERECRAKGYLPDSNQFSGKWHKCITVSVEESESKKLECIRAGGSPVTRSVWATGEEYRIYKTCGAKQVVAQPNPWAEMHRKNAEVIRSWDTTIPQIQTPGSGLRCETRRTINGNYDTRCK